MRAKKMPPPMNETPEAANMKEKQKRSFNPALDNSMSGMSAQEGK